jgi:hypothetical protein
VTLIPVFVGGGRRYSIVQTAVFDALCGGLTSRNLQPSTFSRENWNYDDPLQGVVEHLRGCYGCLIFSVSRYYVPYQYEFPNSDEQIVRSEVILPTVWDYIESTAAYVLGIPLLNIVDQTLYTQVILSTKYASYYAYKCSIADNYPNLSHGLHRELDKFADRVSRYFRLTH